MTKLLAAISVFFWTIAFLMSLVIVLMYLSPTGGRPDFIFPADPGYPDFWSDPNTFAWFFNLSIIAAVAVIAWKARKWDL